MTTRLSRAGACLGATGLLIGMLAACTPEAEPVKTPRPLPTKTAIFESDEEAFAAAEETYRAYNDADNRQRRGDKDADPDEYLTGIALEAAIDGRQELGEMGLMVDGDIPVLAFIPETQSTVDNGAEVTATVCVDFTKSVVRNEAGDVVDMPRRHEVGAQRVRMVWVDSEYLIAQESEGDTDLCVS